MWAQIENHVFLIFGGFFFSFRTEFIENLTKIHLQIIIFTIAISVILFKTANINIFVVISIEVYLDI